MNKRKGILILFLAAALLGLAGCDGSGSTDVLAEKAEDKKEEPVKEASDNKKQDGKKSEAVTDEEGYQINFSLQDYFYSEDVKLEILSSRPGKIYYTTDGTDPGEEQKLYKAAIELQAGSQVKAYCIRAKAYFEDGRESQTITHTYFVGDNVMNRFDTFIFSITSDPYNLYDYEYGILVEGKLRADYVKEHPYDKIDPPAPANYNMRGKESERPIYLEILNPDGTQIAGQAAGVRTYGGWSRASLQKSLKIYTRKEYDEENNKIKYEFFPEKTAAGGDGSVPNSYNRLVLRNCGNDNGFAFIRDELFETLAAQAGYPDYEAVRPASLFINGEYRGMFWLHDVYDDEYFKENYGKYDGSFEILEGGEIFKTPEEDNSNAKVISDYEEMYAFSKLDLTDNVNFNKLSELIDVENYLSYYALQIYIGNEDWPNNNYKTYRYYAPEGAQYGKAPFDGKWRYLLHDLDFSFGIYGKGPLVDNIQDYLGNGSQVQESCPLFGQLMKREDCREIFIKKTLDLINGAYAPDNINSVLDEMNASRMNEQMNMYNKNLVADWVTFDQLEGRVEEIKTYGKQRAEHILTKYKDYFGMDSIYTLSVQPAQDSKIKVNSFVTDDSFIGSYYDNYNTVITAELPEGKKLDYWLVNGKEVKSETLEITPLDIINGKVEVTCMTK